MFDQTGTLNQIAALEGWLRAGLEQLRDAPLVGDVRVIGGLGILELVANKEGKDAGGYLDSIGPRLSAAFLARGLLLRPLGNILYLMPPYVITKAETEWMVEQVADALAECA